MNQALVSSKFSNKLNQNIFNAFHQGPQTSQTTKILKIHKYSCGYYDNNTWFLHLLRRIMSYLMTIRCEMNQILLKTLKNHLKRYISAECLWMNPNYYGKINDAVLLMLWEGDLFCNRLKTESSLKIHILMTIYFFLINFFWYCAHLLCGRVRYEIRQMYSGNKCKFM